MNTIFLCGFMGCGKSTVGVKIKEKCSLSFIDLDEYITHKEKISIPEIFKIKGEEYFRLKEAESLREAALSYDVIATGGGTILNSDSARIARERGTVVFIDVPFEICYERIKNDTNRPLVIQNTKDKLHELYNKRRGIYSMNSNHTVAADNLNSIDEIADIIISLNQN